MNFELRQGGNQSNPWSVSPSPLKLPLGGQSVRPMYVDSANTRSQQRGGFKGEGDRYILRNIK
ncbi:hypothetical protein [Candidatus Regiella insecticola]|uniref:hypothetical protein n=1 Tax=Candidatus Regiella insecticola TaxID=138073 RepID=UPI0002E714A7|nr:hypothetical protein [Candidatus Regiella insecticola]